MVVSDRGISNTTRALGSLVQRLVDLRAYKWWPQDDATPPLLQPLME